MHITPIRTKSDYKETLRIIEGLMFAEHGTKEGDMLDVLASRVETYERTMYALAPPGLIEGTKFYYGTEAAGHFGGKPC